MKLWPGRPSGFGGNTNIKREEERRRSIFTRRAALLGVVQLGALSFLGHRLYRLQIEEGRRYATLAEENRVSPRLFAPPRGRMPALATPLTSASPVSQHSSWTR